MRPGGWATWTPFRVVASEGARRAKAEHQRRRVPEGDSRRPQRRPSGAARPLGLRAGAAPRPGQRGGHGGPSRWLRRSRARQTLRETPRGPAPAPRCVAGETQPRGQVWTQGTRYTRLTRNALNSKFIFFFKKKGNARPWPTTSPF